MKYQTGTIVLALAGRDQEGLFFVVGQSEDGLLLADGKRRKIAHPKCKNVKHVCTVEMEGFDHPVIGNLQQGKPVSDRQLRAALAVFKEGISLG